jgi:hypothetical protein
VSPNGLEGHLGAELGAPADLEEVVALADRTVLGQRPPGLAHEPHGRSLDRLAPNGAHEKRFPHRSYTSPGMERAGEHSVPSGPLAVRWLGYEVGRVRAGAVGTVRVALENAGSANWRSHGHSGIYLSYHWLDERGNAIVWDGLRTYLPRTVSPGDELELALDVRGAVPPGRYRLALDLVAEARLWFVELGGSALELEIAVEPRIQRRLAARGGSAAALAAQEEQLVSPDEAEAIAYLAEGVEPAPDWSRRVLDAHQEGYAFVGGSIEANGGLLARRGGAERLRPWAPGTGRVPHFDRPLLCPSIVHGVEPDWRDEVEGLPALEPPADRLFGEPWLYDGRIAIRYRARSRR